MFKQNPKILPLTICNLVFHRNPLGNNAIHTSCPKFLFFEGDPKGDYAKFRPKPSNNEKIRQGLKQIKKEIEIWKTEIRETLEGDFLLRGMPGVVDKTFEFRNNEDLERWIVTSDKDNEEGQSTCQLTVNQNGKGLFTGNLCLDVPKDGIIKKTGYCNMRTVRFKKSFQRDAHYDWGMYTHLVMRVRGDGRSYALNLGTSSYFDQTWNDVFTYVLFTRGGPYWQYSRGPGISSFVPRNPLMTRNPTNGHIVDSGKGGDGLIAIPNQFGFDYARVQCRLTVRANINRLARISQTKILEHIP
ncbi:Complex I intermediate-associated protein 30, mitochondrial [Homalodisca vitripennis]|nr:Complex I intermediate-associated protein 30, mitochondrial [Homalodisca vitripennis]